MSEAEIIINTTLCDNVFYCVVRAIHTCPHAEPLMHKIAHTL